GSLDLRFRNGNTIGGIICDSGERREIIRRQPTCAAEDENVSRFIGAQYRARARVLMRLPRHELSGWRVYSVAKCVGAGLEQEMNLACAVDLCFRVAERDKLADRNNSKDLPFIAVGYPQIKREVLLILCL